VVPVEFLPAFSGNVGVFLSSFFLCHFGFGPAVSLAGSPLGVLGIRGFGSHDDRWIDRYLL
jgi:hypothetical protein